MTRLTPSTPLLMLRLLGLLACIASGGQTHAQVKKNFTVSSLTMSAWVKNSQKRSLSNRNFVQNKTNKMSLFC